jgi:hypothetical protein
MRTRAMGDQHEDQTMGLFHHTLSCRIRRRWMRHLYHRPWQEGCGGRGRWRSVLIHGGTDAS